MLVQDLGVLFQPNTTLMIGQAAFKSLIMRTIVILYDIIFNMTICNFAQWTLSIKQLAYLANHYHHEDLAS